MRRGAASSNSPMNLPQPSFLSAKEVRDLGLGVTEGAWTLAPDTLTVYSAATDRSDFYEEEPTPRLILEARGMGAPAELHADARLAAYAPSLRHTADRLHTKVESLRAVLAAMPRPTCACGGLARFLEVEAKVFRCGPCWSKTTSTGAVELDQFWGSHGSTG